MKKNIVRPMISVMFVTLALIMSLFTLFTMNGSVAWFAQNSSVNAGGLSVCVDGGGSGFTSVVYYGITQISDLGYTYDDIDPAPENIPVYDPNGINYSRYKPALLLRLEYDLGNGKTYTLRADCLSASVDNILKTQNYLSNAVQFRIADVSGGAEKIATAQGGDALSFVSLASGGAASSVEKTSSIEFDSVSIEGSGVLYLILEYNTPVVNYIGSQRIDVLEAVTYVHDITLSLAEVANS